MRSADGKAVTYKQVKALVTELIGPGPEPNPPSPSHSGFAYSGPRGERLLPPLPKLTCGCPLPWPWLGCSGPERS